MFVANDVNRYALAVLLTASLSTQAWAHGDEPHNEERSVIQVSTPIAQRNAQGQIVLNESSLRLPDGSISMPKSVQRQLGLRTQLAQKGEYPKVVELNGRVIADPNAGGRVQTFQSGRIEAGLNGLAVLGQHVTKGQVLAWLQPASNSIERGTQRAALADLVGQEKILEQRLVRLQQLVGSVPQKDIDQAEVELSAFKKRKAALGGSLLREALVAPVNGVVSVANVAVGQVVDAREIVFEIIDPRRLSVEALAYDPLFLDGLGKASAELPNGTLALSFIGAGRSLKEQAMPVLFKVELTKDGSVPAVAVGQTVKVLAQTKVHKAGVSLPINAVVRNSANESVVWIHDSAEHFISHKVKVEPLDGSSVLVTSGLTDDERVVVQGASSLTQVR